MESQVASAPNIQEVGTMSPKAEQEESDKTPPPANLPASITPANQALVKPVSMMDRDSPMK
jgi:hypothetical protein